jgi:hypothetical protein
MGFAACNDGATKRIQASPGWMSIVDRRINEKVSGVTHEARNGMAVRLCVDSNPYL